VDAIDVVVQAATLLAECRVASAEQRRHRVVAAHIGTRMREANDRLLAAARKEKAARHHAVFRGKRDGLFGRALWKRVEIEQSEAGCRDREIGCRWAHDFSSGWQATRD